MAQPLCHRQPSVHSEQKEMRMRLISLIKALISLTKPSLTLCIPLIRRLEGRIGVGSQLHVGTTLVLKKRKHPLFMENRGGEEVS